LVTISKSYARKQKWVFFLNTVEKWLHFGVDPILDVNPGYFP